MANSSNDPGGRGGKRGGRRGGKREEKPTAPAETPDGPAEARPETSGATLDGFGTGTGRDHSLDDTEAPGRPDPEFREDDLSDGMSIRTPENRDDSFEPGETGGRPYGTEADIDEIADTSIPVLDDDPIGPGGRAPGGPEGPHGDDGDDQAARGGLAAMALKILIFILVIFGLSLWIVPNIAPRLPAGIARHLMPGQVELDERLATLTQRIEESTVSVSQQITALSEQVSILSERVDAVEQTAETAEASAAESAQSAEQNAVAGETVARAEAAAAEANRLADTATTAATEAGKVAAAATRDTASLARRMAGFEARMAELADQVQAVGDSLAEGVAEGEAATPELAAAFAALKSEVENFRQRLAEEPEFLTATEAERFATQDDLRSARMALGAEIDEKIAALPPADALVVQQDLAALRAEAEGAVGLLSERLDEVQGTAGQAAETAQSAEQAATSAVGRVDEAIRQAALRAASAALTSRLFNGVPFGDALDEAATLMDSAPPDELASVADTGVATSAELLRDFNRPARDALEAAIEARSGGGILGQAGARVRAVISGRPANEAEGDTVEAILSRIEARLRESDPAAALAEAEKLPQPAQDALGDWLDRLGARVAAAEAADSWLAPVSVGGQSGGQG